jgi:YD repeat-containing protein
MKHIISFIILAMIPLLSVYAQDTTTKMNKKNLVVKEWNTNAKGVATTLDHVTSYSPDGKKIEEIEYDSAGKQKWRKRYEWGANGKQSREFVYNERNRLVNYKTFEYNEFGKKKTQYTYDAKGKLIGTKIFEYIAQDD